MFNQYSSLFGQSFQTYTLALIFAAILSILWLVLTAPKNKASATFDTSLAGLIGAIVFGRALHLALNWAYFSENLQMIIRIHEQGGLDWHGAILGAFFFGTVMAKFRQLDFWDLLLKVAPLLPLIAFAGWYGCAAAACAYGAPIERMADYPAFLTWVERDIYGLVSPRFAPQILGMAWTGIIFLLLLFLQWRNLLENRRLALALFLLSLGAFSLAFLRGDYALMLYGFRAEQWLDLIFAGIAFIFVLRGLPKRTDLASS